MSVVTPRRAIALVEGIVFPLNSSLIPAAYYDQF